MRLLRTQPIMYMELLEWWGFCGTFSWWVIISTQLTEQVVHVTTKRNLIRCQLENNKQMPQTYWFPHVYRWHVDFGLSRCVRLTSVMSLEAAAALMWRLGWRMELLQSRARANVPTALKHAAHVRTTDPFALSCYLQFNVVSKVVYARVYCSADWSHGTCNTGFLPNVPLFDEGVTSCTLLPPGTGRSEGLWAGCWGPTPWSPASPESGCLTRLI